MVLSALYPCTGLFTVMGVSLLTYGASSGSIVMLLQGLYLTYLGVHMTWTVWDAARHDTLLSE